MKSRVLVGILLVAGIVGPGGRVADASIVLSYSFNCEGEARLVGVESALAHAIQLSIAGGNGLFAVLVGDEVAADGSRLPVLRLRPINVIAADSAIASEAYLTLSFQIDSLRTESTQPSGNSQLGLRTLEFDVSKKGESGEFGCLVQSSLDGFGSGRPVLPANPVATEGSDKIHYSVDISQQRFQDLSEVDFRIYFYSSASDEPLEFDGIRLNGKVIVAPEPSSSLVWALMLAVVLFVVAAAWITQRRRAGLFYAMVGGGRVPTPMSREPWSDVARESILNIIDRGRNR